jgi:hypothetical protein
MSERHPDSNVVDRLGGTTEVARMCRVRSQAVSQWRRVGIPSARRDYLQLLRPDAFAAAGRPLIDVARAQPIADPQESRDAA